VIETISDIKTANAARGHHFFERATLRFFRSKILRWVVPMPDGSALFGTSEQFVDSSGNEAPRRFTLRRCKPDGDCGTVGEFQAYKTAREVRAAAKDVALKASWVAAGDCCHACGRRGIVLVPNTPGKPSLCARCANATEGAMS